MSTNKKRVWHSGPPPHVGWWEASPCHFESDWWRWWDGTGWSVPVEGGASRFEAHSASLLRSLFTNSEIKWTRYWPEGARVPRIDPSQPKASK